MSSAKVMDLSKLLCHSRLFLVLSQVALLKGQLKGNCVDVCSGSSPLLLWFAVEQVEIHVCC